MRLKSEGTGFARVDAVIASAEQTLGLGPGQYGKCMLSLSSKFGYEPQYLRAFHSRTNGVE